MTAKYAKAKAVLTDAEGRVKEFRNGLHAFGASNPFTLATVALALGFAIGVFVA